MSPFSSRSKNRGGGLLNRVVCLGRACLCMLSEWSRLTNGVAAWYSLRERRTCDLWR